MSDTNTTPVAPVTIVKTTKGPDFGEGRYSCVMREAYADSLRLVTDDPAKAEAFARQLGQDLGRAMSETPVSVRYGKASKDGKMTLKEAATVKGVTARNSLTLGRLIAMANDINTTKLARVDSLTLTGTLEEWFNEL